LVEVFNVPWKLSGIGFWFVGFAGRKLSSEVCQPLLDVETIEFGIALSNVLAS
jgi:hypothetical protein